ncbi:polysaccharide deacetylase family protein [Nonomuraea sp. NPDC002799]
MNIGTWPRRPGRPAALRGTARIIATAVLMTGVCGAALATATTGTVHTVTRAVAAPAASLPMDAASLRTKAASMPTEAAPLPTDAASLPTAAASMRAEAASFEAVLSAPEERSGVDCRRLKCVALTFDDGPGPHTDTLLRHLAARRARATFFVVGQNVTAHPGVLRRTVAAGHEIGNHTWSHPDLTRLSGAGVRSQLARTDRAVKAATGIVPSLIRPPYGALNTFVRARTSRPMVMWSVDTLDWRFHDSAKVARKVAKTVRPGSIILFHDIHPTTVRAIPRVLKTLSARGYTFVTVSRLFGGHPPRLAFSGAPPGLL